MFTLVKSSINETKFREIGVLQKGVSPAAGSAPRAFLVSCGKLAPLAQENRAPPEATCGGVMPAAIESNFIGKWNKEAEVGFRGRELSLSEFTQATSAKRR
jgi:hypothetical protein